MKFLTTALVFVLALTAGCATAELEIEESRWIVNDLTAAQGGKQAIEARQTIRADFVLLDGDRPVTGEFRASRDGRMRIDFYDQGKLVQSEGVDSDGAWSRQGDMAAPVIAASDEVGSDLRHCALFRLYGLHELTKLGGTVRLNGWEDLDGKTYQVMKITLADGFQTLRYVDPKTDLVTRSKDLSVKNGTAQAQAETIYSGFETLCGVVMPTISERFDPDTGASMDTTHLIRETCNLADADLALARSDPPPPAPQA